MIVIALQSKSVISWIHNDENSRLIHHSKVEIFDIHVNWWNWTREICADSISSHNQFLRVSRVQSTYWKTFWPKYSLRLIKCEKTYSLAWFYPIFRYVGHQKSQLRFDTYPISMPNRYFLRGLVVAMRQLSLGSKKENSFLAQLEQLRFLLYDEFDNEIVCFIMLKIISNILLISCLQILIEPWIKVNRF